MTNTIATHARIATIAVGAALVGAPTAAEITVPLNDSPESAAPMIGTWTTLQKDGVELTFALRDINGNIEGLICGAHAD